MNKIFTFKRFVASVALIFTATLVMNAQTTDIPWHVVVYENGEEVANHSIEIISDIQVTSQDVTFVLDDGQTFQYPIESTFAFEQRAGGGTAIESVAAPLWNVYYSNGNLHFTERVDNVAVYTVSGILTAKPSGKITDLPVNLAQGVYIVQAGGKSAKLAVTNSMASASAQPIKSPIALDPITMRAANADYKQYWNITVGGSTTPITISDVVNFYFTPDNSIVFSLKNGNNVELANYTGMKFDIQPVQIGNNWDLTRTMLYGGATYPWGFNPPAITFAAVHTNGIAFHTEFITDGYPENVGAVYVDKRITNSVINGVFWTVGINIDERFSGTNTNGRLTMFGGKTTENYTYGMSYLAISSNVPDIPIILLILTDGTWSSTARFNWSYNNNTNLIPTTFVQNADGSITMSCKDYNGKAWSYTFSAW